MISLDLSSPQYACLIDTLDFDTLAGQAFGVFGKFRWQVSLRVPLHIETTAHGFQNKGFGLQVKLADGAGAVHGGAAGAVAISEGRAAQLGGQHHVCGGGKCPPPPGWRSRPHPAGESARVSLPSQCRWSQP